MLKVKYNLISLLLVPVILGLPACQNSTNPSLFHELGAEQTGIHFQNTIKEQEKAVNEFLYMGGGVGIGDFNNDGRRDIFFTGNQVSSKLYINRGELKFQDITKRANLATEKWATGVSIVDINNDGFDDIYVCVYQDKNQLFINNGNLTFTEKAEAYGLADDGDTTQAVFFDYNQDGKTDLFLTQYTLDGSNPNALHPPDDSGYSPANDKLYQNTGIPEGKNHPRFKDVTLKAGIRGDGYGLGVSVSDFNNDSWPDIYVANDFLSSDELWLNNKDGTFSNVIKQALRHQSYSSMGTDAADINNDLYADIITLDMAPEFNKRQKLQYTFMDYNRYQRERDLGYQPAFMRNMLQLNNGLRTIQNKAVPFFSEIGQYAGIAETDWSWSVLAGDYNNDGWKDLYITNGSGRDFLNADFIEQSASREMGMRDQSIREEALYKQFRELGYIDLSNYLYLNNGDYTFTNAKDSSGLAEPVLSNGAAYTDLDNDGDLDLVVNNINEPASVFANQTITPQPDVSSESPGSVPNTSNKHYLQVSLTGSKQNLDAFGSKVFLYANGKHQMQEKYPIRGYLSSVDSRLFFGLGSTKQVDSLTVIWPNNRKKVLKNIPADTLVEVSYNNAHSRHQPKRSTKQDQLFEDITDEVQALYQHQDVPYNDFKAQPLLPQKYSQLGPYIATGDVNGSGLTDFFIGGGFNSSGMLFIQSEDQKFERAVFDTTVKYQEDINCSFFDADGDHDKDLLITYGDTRYDETSQYYHPRLYLNDGDGNFVLREEAIPDHVRTIAGSVAVEDYNGDGQPDVFIGGRVSKNFPLAPRSYLLKNSGGTFTDVTEKIAPELQRPGMITSAIWSHLDGDNKPDLVLAGEWMSIRFFHNKGDHLEEFTEQTELTHTNGLWRSLSACDLDSDGDNDLVAGNLGPNAPYYIAEGKPLKLYSTDLDNNGTFDPIIFDYTKDASGERHLYPTVKRDKLLKQVPAMEQLFPTHQAYSTATFDDIFGHIDHNELLEYQVDELKSSYFINKGNGQFVKHALPTEAQFAPVNSIICSNLDNDRYPDLLLAGNEYQTEVRTGRYDASYGLFLKGGRQHFSTVDPTESGFIVDGDVKDMVLIKDQDDKKRVLVAVNNDSMKVFGIH